MYPRTNTLSYSKKTPVFPGSAWKAEEAALGEVFVSEKQGVLVKIEDRMLRLQQLGGSAMI